MPGISPGSSGDSHPASLAPTPGKRPGHEPPPAEARDAPRIVPGFGCSSGLHRRLLFLPVGKRKRHVHTNRDKVPQTDTHTCTLLYLESFKTEQTFPRAGKERTPTCFSTKYSKSAPSPALPTDLLCVSVSLFQQVFTLFQPHLVFLTIASPTPPYSVQSLHSRPEVMLSLSLSLSLTHCMPFLWLQTVVT